MTPEKTTEQAVNEKVGIGAYLSLAFAVVFFSGLCASSQWWGVFDFTTVNGGFGRLVSGVTEQGDAIKTAMANFRGKGGSGAIDGFMFALSLVPTVMFALAMITVFEHYGALKAARKILTPVLRPLIGIPGSAALAPSPRCSRPTVVPPSPASSRTPASSRNPRPTRSPRSR